MGEIENKTTTVKHLLQDAKRKNVFLKGIWQKISITVKVIRAVDKTFVDAVRLLVVTEIQLEALNKRPLEHQQTALTTGVESTKTVLFCVDMGLVSQIPPKFCIENYTNEEKTKTFFTIRQKCKLRYNYYLQL